MALVGNISGSIQNNSNIGVSGSVVIANRPDALFPTLSSVGGDVVFFVSGSRGGKGNTAERTVSVFGGDAVVSGSLTIGTGSITITSNDITFFGGVAQILSGSGGLTFKDSSGTKTLAELASSTGDVTGPAGATDNALVRFDTTSGKLIQNSLITLSDLDVPNSSVTLDSDATATTVNLFTTNATSVVIGKTAGAAGHVTTSGNIRVGSNIVKTANDTTALTLTDTTGDVTVAGDLKVGGNDIKSSTGATAITLTDGNVIIPGDLTVQGTTTTVDVTTLTVEDPVIGLGFTSGSSVVSPDGDRGFIGGITTGGNVALFWDNTDSTFTSARTTSAAGNTVTITSYTPFRASSLELGGTPGSAVASNSAYLSSSDALNVLVNYKDTATFTKAGVQAVQITDYLGSTGEGMIKGVNALGLAELWLSGTSVSIAAGTTSFVGSDDRRQGTITGPPGGNGLILTAQDGSFTPRGLALSGSLVNLGVSNNANSVNIKWQDVNRGQMSYDSVGVAFQVGSSPGTGLVVSGSNNFDLLHSNKGVSFIQHVGQPSYLSINKSSSNSQILAVATNIISGSSVTLDASAAAQGVEIKTVGSTMLEINSPSANTLSINPGGTYTTANLLPTNATTVNFASVATNLTMGSNATTNGSTTVRNKFARNGNISAPSWTTAGAAVDIAASTLADTTSGGGATIATRVASSINTPTFASTNVITVTNAANLYVASAPLAGTNTSIVNSYAAWINGQTLIGGNLLPSQDVTHNLGSAQQRWANIYTGDLHLKNDRGDYTLIEEEDFLSIRFNKSGKRYKFVLEPVPELDEK